MAKGSKNSGKVLSRERFLAQALDLAQRQGVDFTMRTLGEELGVSPMAIYRHFENRDELINELINAVLGEVLSPAALRRVADGRRGWRSRALEFCMHCYDVVVKYPGSAQLIVTAHAYSPNRVRLTELIVDFLADLGLTPRRSIEIVHSMSLLLFQAATLEQQKRDGEISVDIFVSEVEDTNSRLADPELLDVVLNTSLRERAERGMHIIFDAIEYELSTDSG